MRPPQAALAGSFLSNGRFVSHVSSRGTGFITSDGVAITRRNQDALEDANGISCWVRDRDSGDVIAFGPRLGVGTSSLIDATVSPGAITLAREHEGVVVRMTVWVDASAPIEWRRITIENRSDRERTLDLTTAAEVVLQDAAADAAHPGFSKLFVQTEWSEPHEALIARRRPREADAEHPWLLHALDGPGAIEFETDRVRLRGRGVQVPRAVTSRAPLSGTTGNVLDPVVAMRRVFTLAPGKFHAWHSVLAVAADRETLVAAFEVRRGASGDTLPGAAAESLACATEAEVARRAACALGDDEVVEAHARLAAIAGRDRSWRAPARAFDDSRAAADLAEATGLDPRAWLVVAGAETAPEWRRLHGYARALGLPLALLILDGDANDDAPDLGLAVRDSAALGEERLAHLRSIARAWGAAAPPSRAALEPSPSAEQQVAAGHSAPEPFTPIPAAETLECFNGTGGFADPGSAYVIHFPRDESGALVLPPLPWTNVLAHAEFGTLVSETGAGFTWSGNSREHRLTPWFNDPLVDPHGDALYLRDEQDGRFWSPVPGPAPAPSPAVYAARHQPGTSAWTMAGEGLECETEVGVLGGARLRVTRVRIRNRGHAARRLRLTAYQRLVLGGPAGEPGPLTRCDAALGAVLARNPLGGDFARGVAFSAIVPHGGGAVRAGDDRASFLGPDGQTARPLAMVDGATPAVSAHPEADPAAILETTFELAAGETRTVDLLLGEEDDEAAVTRRLLAWRESPGPMPRVDASASAGALEIRTPEPALDRMVNTWLPWQNLSCRIWGRSAFYQSGGAFGFRDQLQDATAMVWLRPELTREQIRLHARHQFVEGDVLHWWHPPRSRGIRTRFADDLLWLPLLAAFYVEHTGDAAVLDELEPFVTARALEDDEQEAYLEPGVSGETASVYEHAARAIDRSLAVGAHGFPLFGCGDWNDGMSRVGVGGRGESVWMAFFLHAVIAAFAPHADARGETERAARWRAHQSALEAALEREGWDGEWYRRAYYDDGTPLGSKDSDECRIDALVQAWSVISGAAPRARAEQGMRSAEAQLVSREDRLVRLLTPPFEHTPHDPGYIKGYVPGVRENGGQYTHAALWVVQAMAELGWRDHAAATLTMLSPISHTRDAASVARYQVEPYVIAADVYGAPPHVGRGGWTWYTGSAGWMFRAAIESIFGLKVEGGTTLRIRPCVPDEWPGASLRWRIPGTTASLHLELRNPAGHTARIAEARVNGAVVPAGGPEVRVPLDRAGGLHEVVLVLGA